MCGISGIVAFDDRSRTSAGRDVAQMHSRIPHRGPDGEGFALAGCDLQARKFDEPGEVEHANAPARVALAFRWLVVQDPSPAARQPIVSSDGAKLLLHNGEIYNHAELREELSHVGRAFRSRSDSETILAAYEEWGTDCFRRFNGMWAVVLVDLPSRRVVVSRDRFGIRPLFYAETAGRIAFASEIKQILPVLRSVRPNEHYIHDYLNEGTIQHFDHRTFFEGVRIVPPASFAVIDIDGPQQPLRFESYWDPGEYQSRPPAASTFDEAAERFDELLKSSVSLTMRTPASLGSFLSGGLDSSVLSAMVRELEPSANHETYSIVFDRGRYAAFDESPYIDDFVERHRCPNARVTIDAEWTRTMLGDVTWALEEPLVASAQMAQYRAFQLARERGARVVLDGQGSDELLAGYALHQWGAWRDRVVHGRLVSGWREMRLLNRALGGTVRNAVGRQIAAPVMRGLGFRRRRFDFVPPPSREVRAAQDAENAIRADRGPSGSWLGQTI